MSFLSSIFPCLNNDDEAPQARLDPPKPVVQTPQSPWSILYSPGMPSSMAPGDGGYYFDFPTVGSVHYVVRKALDVQNAVHMRYKISNYGGLVPTEGDPPARVRPFLQRLGDNLSGVGEFEHYRFWGPDQTLTADGEFVMDVPLTSDNWTSVYGQHNEAGFQACLDNIDNVGFTFGGTFAGHGVYGQGRFVLLEYDLT